MALVLGLVAFILLLASGEAWAAEQPSNEQPSQTAQQGKVEESSTTTINAKEEGAEPLPGPTPPVAAPQVETLPEQTPLPSTGEETSSAPKRSPRPVQQALPRTEIEPAAQQPAVQRSAVGINEAEEAVKAAPKLSWLVSEQPESAPNAAYSAADSATSGREDGPAVPESSSPSLDAATPFVSALEEDALPRSDRASEPVFGPAAVTPAVFEEAPATSAGIATLGGSLIGVRGTRLPASVLPKASAPSGPVWVGGASALPSTNGSQQSSEENEPQQPVPPYTPPVDSSFFSMSGGGQLGLGEGFAPLMVGLLAYVAILRRRDFRTYLISLEMPRPSSALLLPLERPG